MYDDNPDWRLYFGVIQNMYKNHPVKIDIAGTIESITPITKGYALSVLQYILPSKQYAVIRGWLSGP